MGESAVGPWQRSKGTSVPPGQLNFPHLFNSPVGSREALGANHMQDPCVQGAGEDGPLCPDAGESWMSGVILNRDQLSSFRNIHLELFICLFIFVRET